MVSIEEAQAKLEEVIHEYANAAVRVDRDGAAWDADVEPFGKVQAASRALALAVLEEALRGCHSSACGSVQPDKSTWRCEPCSIRTRIEALGGEYAA